jgi:hypothetical protein
MILILDTAGTGFWQWKQPEDSPAQPHLMRLAALIAQPSGVVVERYSALVRPLPNWPEPSDEARSFHALSRSVTEQRGLGLAAVVTRFETMARAARIIVAHNAVYHRRMIERAWRDMGIESDPPSLPPWRCTMTLSADLVRTKLTSQGRWAWPSLSAAYEHFAATPIPPGQPRDASRYPIERRIGPEEDGLAICAAVKTVWRGIIAERPEREE